MTTYATSSERRRGRPSDDALRHRRCEEILDAAARLFAQRGYAAANTQELADVLEVGVRDLVSGVAIALKSGWGYRVVASTADSHRTSSTSRAGIIASDSTPPNCTPSR